MALTARLQSMDGGINEDGSRFYTRTYQVESDPPVLDLEPDDIDEAVAFVWGDEYPTDPLARLKRKRVTSTAELFIWSLVLEWDTKTSETDKGTVEPGTSATPPTTPGTNTQDTAPPSRPWVYKWGSVATEQPLARDKSGTPKVVANSAGQPFDPPVLVPVSRTTLRLTAFRANAEVSKIKRFINKVNNAAFLEWTAAQARCVSYEVTSIYEQGEWYYQVDVGIEFDENWLDYKVLDAGTVEKSDPDGSGVKLRQIVDATGTAVTSPVPLDGFGAKLAVGGAPVYLSFQPYETDDFDELI